LRSIFSHNYYASPAEPIATIRVPANHLAALVKNTPICIASKQTMATGSTRHITALADCPLSGKQFGGTNFSKRPFSDIQRGGKRTVNFRNRDNIINMFLF
jgi:hypothetical protein